MTTIQIKPGTFLRLFGKSQKGKNRVREWGSQWRVDRISETVQFSNDRGPWAMVSPLEGLNAKSAEVGSRWINLFHDRDFEVEVGP